jgi:histidinol-phosphate aminotransferase
LTSGDVRRLAAVLPDDALLFLDEAYAEFAAETFLPRLDECPNVVIGRTFAKAYGLAGLRAGAVLGSDEAIARLRRVVPPYSLNVFVVAALPAALDDRAYVDDYVEQVRESRALMYDACARLGLSHVPSEANFVLVRAGDRREALLAGLEARNIYVRDRHMQPGCAGCIRITTGIVEHTRLCIEAMEDILCARG